MVVIIHLQLVLLFIPSLGDLEEFETVYRLEDGDDPPQLVVTSDANQFTYEPVNPFTKTKFTKHNSKSTKKNLRSLVTPITINSGSNKPGLTYVDTSEGIDTYTISALKHFLNPLHQMILIQ